MTTPRQFTSQLQGRRYIAGSLGLGMLVLGVAIEVCVALSLMTSLALLPLLVMLVPIGVFIGFLGAILLLGGLRRLQLTVEIDAVTIRSLRTTRIAMHDLLAVNVEAFHVTPQVVIWPRPGAPIRARFASYPSRSSASTGLMVCPLEGWDASAEEVVSAMQSVAGPLWRVPATQELAALIPTSFRRRLSARAVRVGLPGALMLLPAGLFSSGTDLLDFSDTAYTILSTFSLIALALGIFGLAGMVVTLLPQRWSVGPDGIEVHAGGRRDRFAWTDFQRLGHPRAGRADRFLVGWLAPGVSRPRFRLAGFPGWHRRSKGVRLVDLYGWDATPAEMMLSVERFAGDRYDGRHAVSGPQLFASGRSAVTVGNPVP